MSRHMEFELTFRLLFGDRAKYIEGQSLSPKSRTTWLRKSIDRIEHEVVAMDTTERHKQMLLGEVEVRISAIVDARFSLIVDGETASSRARRGGVQALGRNVAQPSTISLKRSAARVVRGRFWGRIYLHVLGPCQAAGGAPTGPCTHVRSWPVCMRPAVS